MSNIHKRCSECSKDREENAFRVAVNTLPAMTARADILSVFSHSYHSTTVTSSVLSLLHLHRVRCVKGHFLTCKTMRLRKKPVIFFLAAARKLEIRIAPFSTITTQSMSNAQFGLDHVKGEKSTCTTFNYERFSIKIKCVYLHGSL